MPFNLAPAQKGQITKAKKNGHVPQSLFNQLRDACMSFGLPAEQAKHATRKMLR